MGKKAWFDSWLQKVSANELSSAWRLVTSGVMHSSVLGPVLFYISDLREAMKYILIQLPDDTKLGRPVKYAQKQGHQSERPRRLEGWADTK